MKRSVYMVAVLATVLLLVLCLALQASAQEGAVGGLTAYATLDDISRYGNVYLSTDRRLLLRDLVDAGIEPGDTVNVAFLDFTMDIPVGMNFSEVPSGAKMLRIKDDAIELTVNMGDFASTYFAEKSTADDGSVTWRYKDGIEGPIAFRIERVNKGETRGEGDAIRLTYTDARSDYPNLSDAAFANFRAIATTGMGEGTLYRTASPIDPTHNRNTYADAALKLAGVRTAMNLMDTRTTAERYEGYGESYYATIDATELGMGMSFETGEFKSKLAEGLRFFATHEGPYVVFCQEGKDRTGVVAALLECFMGAACDEVMKDYMTTFYNYYGIAPGDAAYDQIARNNVAVTLQKLLEVDDLTSADLAEAAEDYFLKIGLSRDETERLRANLGRTYSVEQPQETNMEK